MKYLLLFSISVILLQSCFFSAGSYSYAKYYIVDGMSDIQLVDKIIELKKNYPQYEVVVSDSETIDMIDDNGFYGASFYIEKENIIIYAIVNLNGDAAQREKAEIGLDQVLDAFNTENAQFYKLKEFSKERRSHIETLFETEILDKLGTWKRM